MHGLFAEDTRPGWQLRCLSDLEFRAECNGAKFKELAPTVLAQIDSKDPELEVLTNVQAQSPLQQTRVLLKPMQAVRARPQLLQKKIKTLAYRQFLHKSNPKIPTLIYKRTAITF